MGRIKTDMVKRTTRKLVKAHPKKFSRNYEKNKESLKELAEIRSKKLRNVIAGYAVRLKRQEESGPVLRKRKPPMRSFDSRDRRPRRRSF
ncbi:30S ribosomal protein S17e [Candidatus Woesearchaeota archaeon]|nr:30S ribosomal protein S17e [Candidatus Woesearchaeota archaeon]